MSQSLTTRQPTIRDRVLNSTKIIAVLAVSITVFIFAS